MIRASSLETAHQTRFSNGDSEGTADVPKGGEGRGSGPHELVEAALATCLTISVMKHAAEHGIPLKSVTAEMMIDRSRPPEVALRYSLAFDGPLSEAQLADLGTRPRTTPCVSDGGGWRGWCNSTVGRPRGESIPRPRTRPWTLLIRWDGFGRSAWPSLSVLWWSWSDEDNQFLPNDLLQLQSRIPRSGGFHNFFRLIFKK